MNRNDLISRLVDRKMNANGPAKAFCVCMARKLCFAAKLCFAGTQPAAGNRKK